MQKTVDEFTSLLEQSSIALAEISESDSKKKSAPEKWSKKEILGHLIDSAANNHQRFVRAQATPRLEIPTYEGDFWVAAQSYATEPWPDLVNLWLLFNRHLLHVLKAMPPDVLSHELVIGGRPAVTLETLAADYLRHVDHHLAQLLG